jgi:hypothetical protein
MIFFVDFFTGAFFAFFLLIVSFFFTDLVDDFAAFFFNTLADFFAEDFFAVDFPDLVLFAITVSSN